MDGNNNVATANVPFYCKEVGDGGGLTGSFAHLNVDVIFVTILLCLLSLLSASMLMQLVLQH